MLISNSSWTSRLLIAVPFTIAALLNAVMVGVEHLHLRLDFIARYGFIFSGPWVRLVNAFNITNHSSFQNGWLRGFIFFVALLWIPAFLYSVCVWLLLVALGFAARRLLRRLDPDIVKTLKRRTAITSSIVVVAALSWFAVKLYREQIACNKRGAAFALQLESIEHDAKEKLSIGTKSSDVSRFFAEHGIPLQIGESEAIGTLYTVGCGPLGCGADSALIGVRIKLDSAGAVTDKPEVVGFYTSCL
jgi:type IV secretory pathway TrbD component